MDATKSAFQKTMSPCRIALSLKTAMVTRDVKKELYDERCLAVCSKVDCFDNKIDPVSIESKHNYHSRIIDLITRKLKQMLIFNMVPLEPFLHVKYSIKLSVDLSIVYLGGLVSIVFGWSMIDIKSHAMKSYVRHLKNVIAKKAFQFIITISCLASFAYQIYEISDIYFKYESITDTYIGLDPRRFVAFHLSARAGSVSELTMSFSVSPSTFVCTFDNEPQT